MRDTSNLARHAPDPSHNSRFVSGAYPTPENDRAEPLRRSPPYSERTPRPVQGGGPDAQHELEAQEELRAVPALADLPAEMLAELTRSAIPRRFHAGVTLVEQGATATRLEVLIRGAVKVVPEISSLTSPRAGCCGLLRPCGRAPGSASLSSSLPNPVW